ncbi:MAG TPA: VIT domain-containing protein [Flavobacteriales bacterium]|nr:VIT domain-containing protein [Flavobacteriales bacterium]
MQKSTLLLSCTLLFILAAAVVFITPSQKKNALTIKVNGELAEEVDTSTYFPAAPTNFPALLVKENEADTSSEPLRIISLKMDVKVMGNLAQTTMEMTFYNHCNRQLEGEFCFPLGEGQTISGYAIETNHVMHKGVVVEKAKGRQVFESITRQRVDPGLLEWTKGNNFKTRIFPIPEKGTKTISITIDQELVSAYNAYVYFLPMMFKQPIPEFKLHAEVIKQSARPVVKGSNNSTIQFNTWRDSWVADYEAKNFKGDNPLRFDMPKENGAQTLFVEKNGKGNQHTFYYALDPKKFARDKKLPSKVCLLWDCSASSLTKNTDLELKSLEAYFKKIGNLSIEVVKFNNRVDLPVKFQITNGNCNELKAFLKASIYDGGTQLGNLDLENYTCDEFILCSDGLSTYGREKVKISKTPVLVVSSSQQADFANLTVLANSSGGRYINCMAHTQTEIEKMMTTVPYRFINAVKSSGEISQVYPSTPTDFSRTFSIAGLYEGEAAELTLNFGFGNEIVHSQKLSMLYESTNEHAMVKKVWAQKKVTELDRDYEKNKKEITRLGKKFELVTRNTSLIVLDRVEDYIAYEIAPPDPAMRNAYMLGMAAKNLQKDTVDHKREHLKKVIADFNERLTWWKTDVDHEKLKKRLYDMEHSGGPVRDTSLALDSSRNFRGNVMSIGSSVILNGSVDASLNVTSPYSYAFSTSGGTGNLSGLTSGTFYCTVTDANGCSTWDFGDGSTTGNSASVSSSKIAMKEFDPSTPYIKKLKTVKRENLYDEYLAMRDAYKNTPSFFLDVSDYFIKQGEKETGMTILSNLAEIQSENHQLMRILAHRLQQLNETSLAIETFKQVLNIREEEPQSYRDLGLAYAQKGQYQKAVDYLCKIVNRQWDARFPSVETIVLGEINNIIAQCPHKLNLDSLDKRLIHHMPADVRVVINWDNDNCDMDLWVTDPLKEVCMYSHNRTEAGGAISKDFTGGYGPEEFLLKKALDGKYKIQVNYFASHQTTISGPTTVQAECYTNWGKKNQKKKTITLRLDDAKDVIDIGELEFEG